MKKIYLILAAAVGMTITSCTTNDYLGEVDPNAQAINDGSIQFGTATKGMTRADHVGADAASLLNNKFYVVAFIGDGSTMSQTFDNYLVEWDDNSAGTTQSNTSDWEYVGKTAPAWSGISGNTQTIKFWDYSMDQYDFIAWSPGTATAVTGDPTADTEVKITKPTPGSYAPSYTLQGTRTALAKCYIADMKTAYKADKTPTQPKFQDEIQFSFRNLACKVRVALYETIPGYSVKDVKFYVDATTTPIGSATLTNAHLFTSGTLPADKFFTEGTYTVSFPTKGASQITANDYNKAHVSFAPIDSETNEDFGELAYVGPEDGGHEASGSHYLGRTLPTASYAGTAGDNYYKTMLPNETGTVLMLRVDYTLVPTDGANETITVHGAKAYVPAIYATWKPNYAYTYVFKISDETNGWTSINTADPAGLYPITFDAVVVDSEEFQQNTITTVATPSITTYQLGHNPQIDGSVIGIDEYDNDNGDIFIQVMNGGTLASNLSASGISKFYKLTGLANPTEADVMDALNVKSIPDASDPLVITGRNGVILTEATITNTVTEIPGVNGNIITVTSGTAASIGAPAAGTYAYVYYTGTDNTDTDIYSAVNFAKDASEPDGWDASDTSKMEWYKDPDGNTKCTGTWDSSGFDSSKGQTYYRHYTNLNMVYGVKVIKVVD